MAPALVTLLLLAWLGLVATLGAGYLGGFGWVLPVRHVQLSIPSFLLGTLAQAMTMFYFIGTGKIIKEAVAEAGLDGSWVQKTKDFKNLTFPWAMWAIGFITVTSIVGGAVDTGRLAPWIHGLLGVATVLAVARASAQEIVCISRNLLLMHQLDTAIISRDAAAEEAS